MEDDDVVEYKKYTEKRNHFDDIELISFKSEYQIKNKFVFAELSALLNLSINFAHPPEYKWGAMNIAKSI